ncbi:MAG: DUF7662 domain-containing protein [Dehalococcoidia bacterium]
MPRPRSYVALGRYLAQFRDPELVVAFPTIEAVLGRPLPDAAWQTTAWWTEATLRAPQRAAWRRAGWEVAQVNLRAKVVTFQRLAISTG